jgi:hypothetical protein
LYVAFFCNQPVSEPGTDQRRVKNHNRDPDLAILRNLRNSLTRFQNGLLKAEQEENEKRITFYKSSVAEATKLLTNHEVKYYQKKKNR